MLAVVVVSIQKIMASTISTVEPQISEGSLGPQATQVALWSVVMSDQRGRLGEGSTGTLFRFCSGNNLPLSASWLSAISSNYLSEI